MSAAKLSAWRDAGLTIAQAASHAGCAANKLRLAARRHGISGWATVVRDCPLCGSHAFEVPQYKRYQKFNREIDAFYLRCKRAGLTAKGIANLTGSTSASVQQRLDKLVYDTPEELASGYA